MGLQSLSGNFRYADIMGYTEVSQNGENTNHQNHVIINGETIGFGAWIHTENFSGLIGKKVNWDG